MRRPRTVGAAGYVARTSLGIGVEEMSAEVRVAARRTQPTDQSRHVASRAMGFSRNRWYPYIAGAVVAGLWLAASALLDFPSFQFALLIGAVNGVSIVLTEKSRIDRRKT